MSIGPRRAPCAGARGPRRRLGISAERVIKAVIQHRHLRVVKSHILPDLLDSMGTPLPGLEIMRPDLEWLTNVGIELRYPDREGDREEARRAILTAERILDIVKAELDSD